MIARLFRQDAAGRWEPVGMRLVPYSRLTEEQLQTPVGEYAWLTVPRSVGGRAGDLLQLDESFILSLFKRCGPRHEEWLDLVEQVRYDDPAGADDWLALHEVWWVRRVAGIG